jgi:hypothetical protein
MKATFRRLLAVTALAGATVSLAACGQGDSQKSDATAAAMTAPAPEPGWSMTDLAAVDPADVSPAAPLPQAVPMQASYTGSYRQAPSVDYSGADDVAYAPSASPDDYQYLGMAAGLAGMLGEAPPDYGFDYGGVRPWVWQTADHYYRYAEPVSGGYRYYYYQPKAARPFLISDPYYSYGYRDGLLVTIYDRSGRLLDARRAARQRQAAQNYYARAAELYRAARRERRFGVAASLWQQHRDEIARQQRQYEQARRERQAWQQWEARNDTHLRHRWASEAVVRRQAETSFAGWQKADFRTPAPRFYSDQQRRAQLQKLADIRRKQEAQRVELAKRQAAQRAVREKQQAEVDKLAEQRRDLAERQQRQQAKAQRQRTEQARLDAQHQAQAAEAAKIARQKAAAAHAKQAAERKAEQAKAAQLAAEKAKAAKAREARVAAEQKHQAEQAKAAAERKAQQAKAAQQAAEKAKAAKAREVQHAKAAQQAAEKAKAEKAREARVAAEQKQRAAEAKQAAQRKAEAAKEAQHKAEQAKANGQQARKAAEAKLRAQARKDAPHRRAAVADRD